MRRYRYSGEEREGLVADIGGRKEKEREGLVADIVGRKEKELARSCRLYCAGGYFMALHFIYLGMNFWWRNFFLEEFFFGGEFPLQEIYLGKFLKKEFLFGENYFRGDFF